MKQGCIIKQKYARLKMLRALDYKLRAKPTPTIYPVFGGLSDLSHYIDISNLLINIKSYIRNIESCVKYGQATRSACIHFGIPFDPQWFSEPLSWWMDYC